MNELGWAPCLLLLFGVLLLLCCVAIAWPRKIPYLRPPHDAVKRDAFRDMKGVSK